MGPTYCSKIEISQKILILRDTSALKVRSMIDYLKREATPKTNTNKLSMAY